MREAPRASQAAWAVLAVWAFLALACKGHDHDNDPSSATQSELHEKPADRLELNSGKRWKANSETTIGVHAMQRLVQSSLRGGNPAASLGALQKELQREYQGIFAKCTMKGAAHDQLHLFLVPLGERITALSGLRQEEVDGGLRVMQQHLASYDKFFE